MVIYHPGVTTELTCDVSSGVAWLVNSASYLVSQLRIGRLPGHNINGRNIIIMNNPLNDSQYVCSDGITNGGVYRILVAGECVNLLHYVARPSQGCLNFLQRVFHYSPS